MPLSDDDLAKWSAEDLERVYAELARRRAPRQASPGVYDALVDAMPTLPADLREEIRADLDAGMHPVAVVVAHFGDRPALGAFAQPPLPVADPVAWFGAKPLFVTAVQEMARFTSDRRRIVEAAIELADRLGVPQPEADAIVLEVIKSGRRGS